MKRHFCLVSLVLFASMFMACENEISSPDEGAGTPGSTVVGFSMAGDNTVTKSAMSALTSSSRVIADLSEETGINGLILTEEVTGMDTTPGIVTKGTPVYTENYSDIYSGDITPIGVFATTDWTDKKSDLAKAFEKEGSSNTWTHSYHYDNWPDDNKLTYFFAAPSTLPDYIGTPSFSKEGRAVTFALVSAKYPTTAVNQKDVLFTSKDIEIKRGGTSTNDVLFYHVFTAVKFKVGKPDDSFTITKVELTNMYTSGTCKVTPNYPSDEDVQNSNYKNPTDATKSSACSIWSGKGTRKTFSQTFVGTNTLTSENSDFADSFYNGTTAKDNLVATAGDTKATATFMCIPMTFSSATSGSNPHTNLTITYKDAKDETKTVTVDLSAALNGTEWKAGQLYTYSLSVNDVTVEVTDEVSGDTISNLLITNTGNMDGYIRATITANWVKDMAFSDGTTRAVVVHELNRPSEVLATYFQSLAPEDSWMKDGDFFYYYRYPVHGGQHTNVPLFTSYTVHDVPASALASETVPIDGCYIQLTVSAQIVSAKGRSGNLVTEASKENVQTAWAPGTGVIDFLSTTPEEPAN